MSRKETIRQISALLQSLMIILNISVVVTVIVVAWSAFRVLENTGSVTRLINGNFLP